MFNMIVKPLAALIGTGVWNAVTTIADRGATARAARIPRFVVAGSLVV